MAAFAFVTAISLAAAPAGGVVSLNLCTDELVLLVTDPRSIRSVSYLSHAPEETALWKQARRYRANDGSMLGAASLRPRLIVTMGTSGRDRERLATAVGARLLVLPYASTFEELRHNILTVGRATGGEVRAARIVALMRAAEGSAPPPARDAIWTSAAGRSFAADGLGAAWLRLAGVRQRDIPGERLTLETLLARPPDVLIESRYRADQTSSANVWRQHPAARDARTDRTIATDGRRWTCMGPTLLPEILRLRRAIAR